MSRDLRLRHVLIAVATCVLGSALAGLATESGPDWLKYISYVLVLPAVIVNALGGGRIYPVSFFIVLPPQLMCVYCADLALRRCLARMRRMT